MRLQESPPIQPSRNHSDRAWSMLPVLQALMYCLWKGRGHRLRGYGLRRPIRLGKSVTRAAVGRRAQVLTLRLEPRTSQRVSSEGFFDLWRNSTSPTPTSPGAHSCVAFQTDVSLTQILPHCSLGSPEGTKGVDRILKHMHGCEKRLGSF